MLCWPYFGIFQGKKSYFKVSTTISICLFDESPLRHLFKFQLSSIEAAICGEQSFHLNVSTTREQLRMSSDQPLTANSTCSLHSRNSHTRFWGWAYLLLEVIKWECLEKRCNINPPFLSTLDFFITKFSSDLKQFQSYHSMQKSDSQIRSFKVN